MIDAYHHIFKECDNQNLAYPPMGNEVSELVQDGRVDTPRSWPRPARCVCQHRYVDRIVPNDICISIYLSSLQEPEKPEKSGSSLAMVNVVNPLFGGLRPGVLWHKVGPISILNYFSQVPELGESRHFRIRPGHRVSTVGGRWRGVENPR